MLSLLIMFFLAERFRHSFTQSFFSNGKRRREARKRSGTRQEALFPVEGARIGPDAKARNGRLKEVLLRDKPEVIRLSRGKLSFLPAGFFVGLRPPTSIHSRLTLLFTVCGCLAGFLPLIGIFFRRASTFFCILFFFAVFVIHVSDNDQWISIMSSEIELFWTCRAILSLFWSNNTWNFNTCKKRWKKIMKFKVDINTSSQLNNYLYSSNRLIGVQAISISF